jgi:hypothetical protein
MFVYMFDDQTNPDSQQQMMVVSFTVTRLNSTLMPLIIIAMVVTSQLTLIAIGRIL